MSNIQAVNDKVAIQEIEEARTTEGGLYIPDNVDVKEPQFTGIVISIGKLVDEVEVGDTLYCHRRGGMDMMLDGKVVKILKYDEVYGVRRDG